ncbi:anti-sigma factor antagonist [Bradyrhizobium sp. INPA03-11B]|uniref:anti-sigma factor antagonist n=1 Tax=Bradyrhizobium sp. INPA03-11B TaxID=418598 RepID=UPI00338EB1E4
MLHCETRIESRQAELRRIVALTEQFGTENCLPGTVVNDIQVALDETLSNIVVHGYDNPASGMIVVRLACQNGEVCIEVEDDGQAFDPLQAPLPDLTADLAQRQVGGIGIHFIKSLMDTVCYDRRNGKNLLRMIKRLPARSDERQPNPMTPPPTDGVAVLAPHGRIDTASAERFGDQVVALIRAGCRSVVIDLCNIIYVSSAGFRAMLLAHKLMHKTNGRIVICGLSPELRRLFEIAHFTTVFAICGTREEGLAWAEPC